MLQGHHIIYDPEWVVDLRAYHHKTISVIQHTNSTPQFYADLTNFLHSLVYEWNRVRMELDREEQNVVK